MKNVTTRSPIAMAKAEKPSLKGRASNESVIVDRLMLSRTVCTDPMYMKIEAARATSRLMIEIVALSGQKSRCLIV